MVICKLESIQGNEMNKILWDFERQTDPLILVQKTKLTNKPKQKKKKKKKKERKKDRKKKGTCRLVDFAIPADDRMKIK